MSSRTVVIMVVCIFAFWVLVMPATASVVEDHFNNSTASHLLWHLETIGSGISVQQSMDRLEICIAAEAQDAPGAGVFRTGYVSNSKLTGDFDIQVDFQLLDWPKQSGLRVGLATSCGTIERTSRGAEYSTHASKEEYATNIGHADIIEFWGDNVTQIAAAKEGRGKLRLVRKANRETGYFYRAGRWVKVGSQIVTEDGVRFALLVWSHNERFTHKAAKVAFDNFIVHTGNLTPTAP